MKKITLVLLAIIGFTKVHAQCSISISGDTAICAGSTTTLTASGATTYSWTPATGLDANTGNIVHASPNSTTVYTVTASTGTCTTSHTVSLTVNSIPTATFNSSYVCSGNPSSFTCTVTPPTMNVYNWNFGDASYGIPAGTSTVNNPSYTYSLLGTFPVSLTVTTAQGCSVTASNFAAVAPTPSSSFSAAPVCFGDTTVFISTTLTVDSSNTYVWNFGNGSVNTVSTHPKYMYPVAYVYLASYSVTTSLGCSSITTNTVVVYPVPTVNFILKKDTINTGVWNVYPSYSANVTTANWNWGDGSSTSGLYPSHTYTTAATYSICVDVQNNNGCAATYCLNDSIYRLANNGNMVYVYVLNSNQTTGMNQFDTGTVQFTIYPNPASNSLQIGLNNQQLTSVNLYNVIGNLVINTTKTEIDVSQLDEGVYFVEVRTKEGVHSKKIIVQH